MKRLSTFLGATLGCLFLLVLFGGTYVVLTAEVSVASISTLKTGRTVTAQSDEWGGINFQDSIDSSTIETAKHVIVVAPSKLIVDNPQVATIDQSVKNVAIRLHKGKLTFEADGKRVDAILR